MSEFSLYRSISIVSAIWWQVIQINSGYVSDLMENKQNKSRYPVHISELCAWQRFWRNRMWWTCGISQCTQHSTPKSSLFFIAGVGKTSLVHLICHNEPQSNPSATIGCSVEVKVTQLFGMKVFCWPKLFTCYRSTDTQTPIALMFFS